MMMAGANVIYLEAYPLNEYSMYGGGAACARSSQSCWRSSVAGKLDRVKMMSP